MGAFSGKVVGVPACPDPTQEGLTFMLRADDGTIRSFQIGGARFDTHPAEATLACSAFLLAAKSADADVTLLTRPFSKDGQSLLEVFQLTAKNTLEPPGGSPDLPSPLSGRVGEVTIGWADTPAPGDCRVAFYTDSGIVDLKLSGHKARPADFVHRATLLAMAYGSGHAARLDYHLDGGVRDIDAVHLL